MADAPTHIVYMVENTKNDHFYVGVHKLRDGPDTYMGSGKLIRRAMAKHGRKAFCRHVLFVASSARAA